MKAAVFLGARKVELREISDPVLKEGEVIVKVGLCGICGTDAHIFSGELRVAKPPVVLGHEISGEIVDLGRDVLNLKKGQKVSIDPVITCGHCEYCHTNRYNLCEDQSVIGYIRNGGFAQYLSVPLSHVYPFDHLEDYQTGILTETLACVLHGLDRIDFRSGHSVMILGAGTVGLLWNQIIKNSLSSMIIQTDVIEYRRNKAKILGADYVFDGKDPHLNEKVISLCPDGIDYIIDATGDHKAIQQALSWIRKGGTLMIFGVCAGNAKIEVSPFLLYGREVKIIASKMPPGTLNRSVRMLTTGLINVNEIVTTVLSLDQIGEGFRMFTEGKNKVVKIAIDPWK